MALREVRAAIYPALGATLQDRTNPNGRLLGRKYLGPPDVGGIVPAEAASDGSGTDGRRTRKGLNEMAGQAGHLDSDGTGQTGGRFQAARVRASRMPEFAPQAIDRDHPAGVARSTSSRADVFVDAPLGPDVLPRTFRTQASYRLLTATGLSTVEASGLIGYALGLKTGEQPWTLAQVNKVLFLRELYSSDDWGKAERQPA